MARKKQVTRYNIPRILGIKSNEWRSLVKRGLTPPPDGVRVNPNGNRDEYWFEDTLVEWFRSIGRVPEPRDYERTRRRDILGRRV